MSARYTEHCRYRDEGGTWIVEFLDGYNNTSIYPQIARRRLGCSQRIPMTGQELQALEPPTEEMDYPAPAWTGEQPAFGPRSKHW